MKKVLFATTALVATASVAAADVTFGGQARFGLFVNTDGEADGSTSTDITSRFRLVITATAESDAGVTFGAMARIQQDNDGAATTGARLGDDGVAGTADDANFRDDREETGINGVRFSAKSGGLEVAVGNIFGALESMKGMYPIDLGLTGHNYDYTAYNFGGDAYNSDTNGSAGSNGIEVIYSFGDFSAHVSASDTSDRLAAHVSYAYNGITFSLGGQDSDNASDTELAASVNGNFAGVDVTLAYADNGTKGDHIVLAGRFDVGAATNVEVYVADADQWDDTSFGIDFNHSMGGGTSLRSGISTGGSAGDAVLFDAGVRFDF